MSVIVVSSVKICRVAVLGIVAVIIVSRIRIIGRKIRLIFVTCYFCCFVSLYICKIVLFYIGAVTRDRMRGPFANRTNVYRCEDGHPICYCCLRVGHVAKYFWDRRYSCPHAVVLKASQPEQAPKCDFVGVLCVCKLKSS